MWWKEGDGACRPTRDCRAVVVPGHCLTLPRPTREPPSHAETHTHALLPSLQAHHLMPAVDAFHGASQHSTGGQIPYYLHALMTPPLLGLLAYSPARPAPSPPCAYGKHLRVNGTSDLSSREVVCGMELCRRHGVDPSYCRHVVLDAGCYLLFCSRSFMADAGTVMEWVRERQCYCYTADTY